MAFPFIKSIDKFIDNELNTRKDPIKASQLVPWIKITSNLAGGYELGSSSYPDLFGSNGLYRSDGAGRFRPNPIITDFSVDFASRGTLRRATFKIKCYTVEDLSKLQEYFLEPGISCFIQWGWNKSLLSGNSIIPLAADAGNVNLYNRNPQALNEIRQKNNGCYDNMVGIITGGESFINGEEFGITVKVCSIGEILMGRSQETITTDEDKVPTEPAFTQQEIESYEGTTNLNYAYAFNAFPAEHRTNTIKDWIKDASKVDTAADFIGFNESLIEEAQEETKKGEYAFGLITFNQDVTLMDRTFSARDSTSPVTPKKYIRFRNFIDIMNETRLKLNDAASMNFNLDISTTYISCFRRIFSTDERVFIPNNEMVNYFWNEPYYRGSDTPKAEVLANYGTAGRGRVSFPAKTDTTFTMKDGTSVTLPKHKHGWIGNVYLDSEIVFEALRDVKRPVKEVLDGVLKVMEDAVEGMWNFQVVQDGNELRISDGNLRNANAGLDVVSFYFTGTNSFFLDASFNMDIPKAMASKVVMEKSVDGSVSGDGEPEPTGLFSDKKDTKLEKVKVESNAADKKPSTPLSEDDIKKNAWIDLRRNIKIMIDPTIVKKSDIDSNINKWGIYGIYLNKKYFNIIRKQDTGYNRKGAIVYNGRPLPVKFNFTTLGMSGFQVGQLFKIIGLPSQYTDINKGAFMITEVTHKVDNKHWTTSVEAMFKPFTR
jgi:hypothetical protein